jgi:hypothetical protein
MIACINAVANEDQRRRSRMTDGLLLQVKLDHASGGKGPDLLARKGATAWHHRCLHSGGQPADAQSNLVRKGMASDAKPAGSNWIMKKSGDLSGVIWNVSAPTDLGPCCLRESPGALRSRRL